MARLPTPGQDNGTWGDILNDYLSQSHAGDGTLKPGIVGSSQIVAGAVTSTQLANNTVTATQIANGTITEAQLDTTLQSKIDSSASDATPTSKGLIQLAGDLTGTAAAPQIAKIQGITLSGTPSAGHVLTASSGTTASWSTAPITSIFGRTGAVTAQSGDYTKAQVGLGSVDNTSDATKNSATAALTNKDLTSGTNTFPTFNQNTTGNAATATTATKFQTARTINGVSFDGSANITVADSTKEPTITVGSNSQYWRGDKSWQNLTAEAATAARWLVPTVQTTTYSATASDMVIADATAGAFTVTLPITPADKTRIAVKKIDSTANAVTIQAGGTDVFNKAGGSSSLTLTLSNQAMTLQYTSSTGIWYVMADDLPLSQLDARYGSATGSNNWLTAWAANIDQLIRSTTITRDANGAATGASVIWPDGTGGIYTGTASVSFPGAVDSYTVTYAAATTRTVTQPTVTRDSSGNITNRPAMGVS